MMYCEECGGSAGPHEGTDHIGTKELTKTTKISVTGVQTLIEINRMLNIGPELYCAKIMPTV
jgi:hypothetical protein